MIQIITTLEIAV